MNPNEVIDLVHQAKAIICDPVKSGDISRKGAADFVTEADKSVQDFLGKALKRLEPDAIFFAEEQENEVPQPERAGWILDPIDGTMNMIRHQNFSAVSLAYCEGGVPLFGVVYNPFTEEAGAVCRTYAGNPFPAYRHADTIACAPGIYEVLQGYLKDAGGING